MTFLTHDNYISISERENKQLRNEVELGNTFLMNLAFTPFFIKYLKLAILSSGRLSK
jgi:hypothetical protein